jgi:L-ribulose-5-phosphate 3-epimerase UlaE
MFVIYSAFKLWDIDVLDIDKAQEYSHPPNSIRISLMEINIVSIFLEKYKSENIKNIISKIRESSKIAEDAFVKITFKLSTHDTFIMNTIMGQDYIKYIRYNWNKVRPLLEPFAFGTLPPLQVSE